MAKAANPEATEQLAIQLYKHLDFKSAVVAEKVKIEGYVPTTVLQIHSLIRKYILTGEQSRRVPKAIYPIIDDLKSRCYAKLTPSEEEKARPFRMITRTKRGSKVVTTKEQVNSSENSKSSKLNISTQTLDNIKKQQEKQRGVQHKLGILVETGVRLFKNEDQLSGYMMACKDVDPDAVLQVVDVTITPRV